MQLCTVSVLVCVVFFQPDQTKKLRTNQFYHLHITRPLFLSHFFCCCFQALIIVATLLMEICSILSHCWARKTAPANTSLQWGRGGGLCVKSIVVKDLSYFRIWRGSDRALVTSYSWPCHRKLFPGCCANYRSTAVHGLRDGQCCVFACSGEKWGQSNW